MFIKIIWNEIKKEILTSWSYRLQWLGEFLSLLIFFMFLINLTEEKQIAAISYCLWFYSILIIGDISGKISTEMKSGTLEQIYLSIIPIPFLFFTKVISSIVRASLIMGGLFILLWGLGYLAIFNLPIKIVVFATALITPGLFGLSLILGGLTILLKDIGWIINIVNNSLLFLSGIFIPLKTFPQWLQHIAQTSLITKAVEIINNNSITSNWFLLFINSFCYLLFGFIIFLCCEKRAKLTGTLGHH